MSELMSSSVHLWFYVYMHFLYAMHMVVPRWCYYYCACALHIVQCIWCIVSRPWVKYIFGVVTLVLCIVSYIAQACYRSGASTLYI